MSTSMVATDDEQQQQHRKRYSVADLMDKLLEDIYRVGSGGGSVASESSTDQTNWSDGGIGGMRPTIGSSKRLARKSITIFYSFFLFFFTSMHIQLNYIIIYSGTGQVIFYIYFSELIHKIK